MTPPEQLKADVSRASKPEQMASALRRAYTAIDAHTDHYIAEHAVALDCCPGCSLCCYLRVDAKAHEVLAIAHFVHTRFTPAEREQLIGRLRAHSERVAPLSYPEHMATNVVCPLLVDGRCTVYAMRPFGCRRHQSQRVSACQYSYDHPEDLAFPSSRHPGLFMAAMQAEQSLQAVYPHLGYDSVGYELGTALLEALTNPKSWRRWKTHKKTFLQAATAPADNF